MMTDNDMDDDANAEDDEWEAAKADDFLIQKAILCFAILLVF